MFQRILATLFGKPAPDASADRPAPSSADRRADQELIEAFDANGARLRITRKEWRSKFLLPGVTQDWHDADALYTRILMGVDDGFAADLGPAAQRLLEIDANAERGHTMLSIVQLKNGDVDAAEATLQAGIAKAGPTGTLLTNMAKVFAERGDETRMEQTLWQAVQADPNQENGLGWWAAIEQERGGAAAYVAALETARALPGSWRPQMALAQHYLEQDDVAAARALYEGVLAQGAFDRNALLTMSAQLGSHGQAALMLALVGPHYDVHVHHPMTGLNLLRACEQLRDIDAADVLLGRMAVLDNPAIQNDLAQFGRTFQAMLDEDAAYPAIDLSRPIWQYGLRNPDWLFANKADAAPGIAFFALSAGDGGADDELADDLALFTRAIPLYLAEAAHYWTDCAASCYIALDDTGPVVATQAANVRALFDVVPKTMRHLVTGEIGVAGAGWSVTLTLWDCGARSKLTDVSGTAADAQFGELVLSLETRLLGHLGFARAQPLDAFYQRPPAALMPPYLIELGQAYMAVLIVTGRLAKEAMWGERELLEWPLTMAHDWPQLAVPKLMAVAAMGRAASYGSDLLPEFAERVLLLLREAGAAGSPVARLAPLMWKVFGMEQTLQAHVAAQPADADPAYLRWLEQVGD